MYSTSHFCLKFYIILFYSFVRIRCTWFCLERSINHWVIWDLLCQHIKDLCITKFVFLCKFLYCYVRISYMSLTNMFLSQTGQYLLSYDVITMPAHKNFNLFSFLEWSNVRPVWSSYSQWDQPRMTSLRRSQSRFLFIYIFVTGSGPQSCPKRAKDQTGPDLQTLVTSWKST